MQPTDSIPDTTWAPKHEKLLSAELEVTSEDCGMSQRSREKCVPHLVRWQALEEILSVGILPSGGHWFKWLLQAQALTEILQNSQDKLNPLYYSVLLHCITLYTVFHCISIITGITRITLVIVMLDIASLRSLSLVSSSSCWKSQRINFILMGGESLPLISFLGPER